MKTKILKLAVIVLIIAGMNSCNKNVEYNQAGISPSSIEDVVDIFELTYGEVKNYTYNGQTFEFSIADVDDKTLSCALLDSGDDMDKNSMIHVSLRTETGNTVFQSNISSAPCVAYYYRNDGTDIQDLWDRLETWQSSFAQQNDFPFFRQEFESFGKGALLKNTSLSVYLGKFYPQPNNGWDLKYKENKNQYKFIFIITKK